MICYIIQITSEHVFTLFHNSQSMSHAHTVIYLFIYLYYINGTLICVL